jgi:hypothetical protein
MSAGVLKTRPRALWPETIDTMQCLLIAEVRAVTATTSRERITSEHTVCDEKVLQAYALRHSSSHDASCRDRLQ